MIDGIFIVCRGVGHGIHFTINIFIESKAIIFLEMCYRNIFSSVCLCYGERFFFLREFCGFNSGFGIRLHDGIVLSALFFAMFALPKKTQT